MLIFALSAAHISVHHKQMFYKFLVYGSCEDTENGERKSFYKIYIYRPVIRHKDKLF
jgi:hypothetical protein